MPPQEAGKLSLGPAQTANPTHGITWAQCVNVNLSFHDPAVASLESKPLHVTSNNTIQISVVQILSEILEKSQSRRTIFPVFPPSWETTCSSWPLWPCHGQYKHKHARTLIASEFHVKTTSSLQFNGDSIWVSSRLIFRKWGSSAKFCSKGTGSSSMLSIPKAEASSKCSSLGNMSRWFVQQRAATRIRNALIIHLNPFNQEKSAFFSRRQARVHQVQPRLGPGALPEIVGTDSSQLLRNEVRAAGWIWIYIKTARTWCLVGGIMHNHPKHS